MKIRALDVDYRYLDSYLSFNVIYLSLRPASFYAPFISIPAAFPLFWQ